MESIEKFLYTWQDDFLEDLDINEKNNLTYASYERIINYFIEYATIKNQVNLIEQIDHRFINQFLKYREDEATRLKDKTKGFEYKTKMLYKTVLKLLFDFIEDESNDKYTFNIKWKRLAFDGKLPDEINWRKDKMGWPIPENYWFRGNLKEWFIKQINNSKLVKRYNISIEKDLNSNINITKLIRYLNISKLEELFIKDEK
jgi:6-pyruvoyl-tetrahydropterin synthase